MWWYLAIYYKLLQPILWGQIKTTWQRYLISLSMADVAVISNVYFQVHYTLIVWGEASWEKLIWGEAIVTWASSDPDLCHHMTSLGHIDLNSNRAQQKHEHISMNKQYEGISIRNKNLHTVCLNGLHANMVALSFIRIPLKCNVLHFLKLCTSFIIFVIKWFQPFPSRLIHYQCVNHMFALHQWSKLDRYR